MMTPLQPTTAQIFAVTDALPAHLHNWLNTVQPHSIFATTDWFEALISFSNAAFYAGELVTIPDRRIEAPLEGEAPLRSDDEDAGERGADRIFDLGAWVGPADVQGCTDLVVGDGFAPAQGGGSGPPDGRGVVAQGCEEYFLTIGAAQSAEAIENGQVGKIGWNGRTGG